MTSGTQHSDHPKALDAIDRVCKGQQGMRSDIVDNINEVERPDGTSREGVFAVFAKIGRNCTGRFLNRAAALARLRGR